MREFNLLTNEQAMLKLRVDVDYPYESRTKSFLTVALRIKSKSSKDYLKNARIIARMINESPKNVKAYWFFTPYTIPDRRLLDLLNPERHEVALHVATNPFQEWKILENETNRTVNYYTIHGTDRKFARMLWGRKLTESKAKIPTDFPLKSFHDFLTYGVDAVRYNVGFEEGRKVVNAWIKEKIVLAMHPEWLFQVGSHRGPFYDVLKSILEVDSELETLRIRKKLSVRIANDSREYERDLKITAGFIEKLGERKIDILTFLERKWCCPIPNPPKTWTRADDNVGLLEIKDYETWWQAIGKKTRNMVRRAEKSGIKVTVVEPSEKLAEGIWKIYNETPIRQERAFTHYGEPLEIVRGNMYAAKNNTFIGAFLDEELVGFIQVLYGDNIAIISNILALQKHWDKAVNNALLAKAVEVCASKGVRWLMYGRIGNHPSLDRFKNSNGFVKFPITRYYIPITRKGKLVIYLGLHREFKDALPDAIKYPLIPAMNWASRTRMRVKLRLRA
jgi:hypothetical protein